MVKDPTKEDDGSLAQTSGKAKQKKKKRESFGTYNNRLNIFKRITDSDEDIIIVCFVLWVIC